MGEDGEQAKAAWARYQAEGGSTGEKERSEAAENQRQKEDEERKKNALPKGDHSVFVPGEAGDPGDKGVEGYTQMPYDYR